jgi:hypothetical protein
MGEHSGPDSPDLLRDHPQALGRFQESFCFSNRYGEG